MNDGQVRDAEDLAESIPPNATQLINALRGIAERAGDSGSALG